MNYLQIAETLDNASLHAKAVQQISQQEKFDLNAAYAIQSISLSRRYIRGEKLLGLKLGFTSKAKMEQMGVHDMIWGRLTDKMLYQDQGKLVKSEFIHPRAEPEIAFRISKTISKPVDLSNAKEVVDGLALAIEIIDSRYENFSFSLEDVVADNCSSAGFLIGSWHSPEKQIQDIGVSLLLNDEVVHEGNSNAILGNPWESLVAAIRLALDNGEKLEAGSIILAGAATAASYIEAGQKVSAKADGFESICLFIS